MLVTERLRLLITSVGSLVGQNILEGLAHRRREFRVVGLNSLPDAVSNFLCDRVYRMPTLADEVAFAARLDEIVAAEAPDIVIPGRDDDIVFLAHWQAVRDFGRPLAMVGTPVMADTLRDKVFSCEFAQRHGLPFVATVAGSERYAMVSALAAEYGWPLIAKPRTGDGSRGVVLVLDAQQLQVAATWPGYCFQPYLGTPQGLAALQEQLCGGVPLFWCLPGIEKISLDGWITPSGEVGGLFCTRHSEIVFGRSERVEIIVAEGIQRLLERFAAVLSQAGWRGPFNLQLAPGRDGRLMCFEMNGRFTGSSATLLHLGCDQVYGAIDAFLGGGGQNPVDITPVLRVDKRLKNWPMPSEAMSQLGHDEIWSRLGDDFHFNVPNGCVGI